MSFAKQIAAAREKRQATVTAMEALVTTAESEERALTEDEQKQFDAMRGELTDIDARLKTLAETEEIVVAQARAVTVSDDDDVVAQATGQVPFGAPSILAPKPKRVKGGFFARQAHLLYVAGGNAFVAAQIAEQKGDKEMGAVLRAAAAGADSTTSAWAGALVQQETQDFIDLLRPMTVFGRINAGVSLDFAGTNSIKIPKMTTGTPGGFVAEGGAIPVKEGAFGSLTITPSKLGVITVATREVLARSTPALETLLRDMMLRDTAITLDRRFLCSTAAGSGAPSGLFHTDNAPAAITASNLSNPADDAIADIKAMMTAMYTANVPMDSLVWLMHPTRRLNLMALRSATGAFYFRDELIGGTLNGIPVIASSVFDFGVNNGGATNTACVALVDASLLVKGNGIAPTISLSTEATLHMDTAPNADMFVPASGGRSLFQTDSSALRLTWETTWRMRHTVGVQYVTGVNW